MINTLNKNYLQNLWQKTGFSMIDWLTILLVFSLLFPVRKVLDTQEAILLGYYSDFTSISFYLSDIILLCIVIVGLLGKKLSFRLNTVTIVLLFSVFLLFISNFRSNDLLYAYKAAKFAELIVLFEITSQLVASSALNVKKIAYISIVFALLNGFIAFVQIILNHSVGFKFLGESILNPNEYGIAKFVAHGTNYLRAYSTFPHPNIFGAWVFAFFSLTTWWTFIENSAKWKLYAYISSFFVICAVLTYSRSALSALLLFSATATFISVLFLKNVKFSYIYGVFTVLISIFLIAWLFNPSQANRNEESGNFRLIYNQIGLRMTQDNPVLGLGFGQSILKMNEYSPKWLQPWQIQPIHNYFLLSSSELGILFTLLLVALIFYPVYLSASSIWNLFRNRTLARSSNITAQTLLGLVVFCIFLLMQVDHYFYTLQQGQFLLWIVLGLYYGSFVFKKPLVEQ